MSFLRKNFSRAYLAADIDEDVVQLTVQAGHTLPIEAGQFRMVIWDNLQYPDPGDDPNTEIVTAEYSGTSNVYNIVRAQEDTLNVSHNQGNRVGCHYTAGVSENDLPIYDSFLKCFLIVR
jgi:hypothetical protein